MKSIKDLIYFDIEKAQSLLSQLNQGLVSEISRAIESENEENGGLGFDVKIVQANIGGKEKEKTIRTEKINLYHEILNEIELQLEKSNSLTNINDRFHVTGTSFDSFMEQVPSFNYIKAEGWALFEDHARLKRIARNFNDIQRFIFTAQLSGNEDLNALKKQLQAKRKEINKEPDRNKKAKDLNQLKSIEDKIDRHLEENSEASLMDEDFISGMINFLDTFAENRLTLRLVPLDYFSDFQILAHLKEKHLVDGNLESIIYTYGSRPNVKISVFGIITACPTREDKRINPADEFVLIDESEMKPEQVFDKAFRHVFTTFEEFDKFFHVPAYPKIAISPIAVYREVKIG